MKEKLVRNWPFQFFPGELYKELVPRLFPWANIEVDEQTYDWAEEERWQLEEGIWDSEDQKYIMAECQRRSKLDG